MSRYGVEVNTTNCSPFFLWEEYLKDIYPHEYMVNIAIHAPDKGFKTVLSPDDVQALASHRSDIVNGRRLARIHKDKMQRYMKTVPSLKFDYAVFPDKYFYFDNNSVLGNDPVLETWFLQAFETSINDCDTLLLWLGNRYRAFADINDLFMLLAKAGIWLFFSNDEFENIMRESCSMGRMVEAFAPLLEKSCFSGETNRFVQEGISLAV